MGAVLELIVAFVVSRVLTYAVVVRDERRLSPERLARAWPRVSLLSAVFQFAMLAIPVHFARTRRSVLGLLLGVLWAVAVLVATALATELSDLISPAVG